MAQAFRKLAAAAVGVALGLSGCAPERSARGALLAEALGCRDCHSGDLTGQKVSHDDSVVVLYASNLTLALPRYSNAAFKTVLTTGVRPDGSRLWYMDAAPYAVLSDSDFRDLLAYLRTLKPAGEPHPRIRTTPRFDDLVRKGVAKPESATLDHDLVNPPAATAPGDARGRYLARIYCAGCHAPSLRGFTPPQAGDPPDLAIAAAYSRAEFRTLLSKGEGPGGRAVGEMGQAARKRFAHLPTADVDALHAYLTAWAKARRD